MGATVGALLSVGPLSKGKGPRHQNRAVARRLAHYRSHKALDGSAAGAYASFQEVGISGFRKLIIMSTLVKIQRKGQVTIPVRLRVRVGLVDGDLLEAKAERGRIVLTPKLIVDRDAGREYTPAQRRVIYARLTKSLEQAKRGETHGPFETHEEMTAFLHGQVNKSRTRKTRSDKPSVR